MSEPAQEGAVRTDDEGYLVDPSDWSPQVAQVLAEREGIALDYATNGDLEAHPEILGAYRLVLSVGHDEYWSREMRDAVNAAPCSPSS